MCQDTRHKTPSSYFSFMGLHFLKYLSLNKRNFAWFNQWLRLVVFWQCTSLHILPLIANDFHYNTFIKILIFMRSVLIEMKIKVLQCLVLHYNSVDVGPILAWC